MTRVGRILAGVIVLILAVVAAAWLWLDREAGRQRSRTTDSGRLNLVLISLDTCRPDRLSPYGAPPELTPALSSLAAEATIWTNCLAQSTSTGPSHRSIFSGQYVHRHGMYENKFTEASHSMASLLRERGWQTAGFTGGGYLRAEFGFDHGFDVFVGLSPEGRATRGMKSLSLVLPRANDWLDRRDRERPFFLFVHAYDPHCPYWPPEPFRSRYMGWYHGALELKDACGPADFDALQTLHPFDEQEWHYLRDAYDASIASADHLLAGFLGRLAADGLLETTIVVFTSDHGEALGEHGWIGHTRMGEEQIRVPLLIRFPGGRWAGLRGEPVQLIDLLPTLLDAMQVPFPAGVQGLDLMPVLRGEERVPAERMRLCKYGGREAVRFDDRWKLVFRRRGGEIQEKALYDLAEDPDEDNNLYETAAGMERGESLLARYLAWREQTAPEDRAARGKKVRAVLGPERKTELSELGYTGEDQD